MSDELHKMLDAFEMFEQDQKVHCFNMERPELKATAVQQRILEDEEHDIIYVLGGNRSGKSSIGGRIMSWWFNDNHPYMSRPKEWGTGPLTFMVIGRVGEQVESELYEKKIKPFLTPGTYKVKKVGASLARIVHDNGNRILFFSHHAINEAREKVQAFTTHGIWLDEMADSVTFINELKARLLTTGGKMIATFTPLVRSEDVRRLVDSATGRSVKYVISMLDNPVIANNPKLLSAVMEEFTNMSDAERQTRIYGDWYIGDHAVYDFDGDKHCGIPSQYIAHVWRHIASIDPASEGLSGLTIWAEDPRTGVWYCVQSHYIKEKIPTEIVNKVETIIAPYNIVRRISDPHEGWFIQQAASMRVHYIGVYNKNNRKDELIKNLQTGISSGKIKIHPSQKDLIDEFITCQYSETTPGRIVNSSRFHLLDSAQYFYDNVPKFVPAQPNNTVELMESQLRVQSKLRRARDEKKARHKRWRRR